MRTKISYSEALSLVLENAPLARVESLPLMDCCGRVLAEDVAARVDSPSVDASLKDGYAVHSADVLGAGEAALKHLTLVGFQNAGEEGRAALPPGAAIRVTTGAALPPGAEAVLASEFASEDDGRITCWRDAAPGRNVLFRGTDVAAGQTVAGRGDVLHPALIGLLAAAGVSRARVYAKPKVAVLATGDEVVAPGGDLPRGRLYASNMVETVSWLRAFGFEAVSRVAPDRGPAIRGALAEMAAEADAVVTSGGAWKSERDLVIGLLADMGWRGYFHRVRLGPGKAVGFGVWSGKAVFVLPGGPPSHEAAFLLLALPGLLAMSGRSGQAFPTVPVRLTASVEGLAEWTQCIHARLTRSPDGWSATPVKTKSRLSGMAEKDALILLPEGVERLEAGAVASALDLSGTPI